MDAPEQFHWNEHQLEQLVRTIPMFVVPPARSRSVCAVGYDQDAALLAVQLRGHEDMIYAYVNVPPAELEALLTAASMRLHLNEVIRARHRCIATTAQEEAVFSF
jgi:hypothetical protein